MQEVTNRIWGKWSYTHNAEEDKPSRIIVGWDTNLWNSTLVSKSRQLIVIDFASTNTDMRFTIGFAYGGDKPTIRRHLWDEMRIISAISSNPLCILGDFNAIISPSDAEKGITRWPTWFNNFNDCMRDAMLSDIRAT